MPIRESILFADIGNSRIKLFKEGVKNAYHYKNNDFATQLSSYLQLERFEKVVYSSTSTNVENIFLTFVRNKKVFDSVNVKELLTNQNIINLSNVKNMGQDRWLGLMGAIAYAEPPIITIDCGTAVTVNVLDYKYDVLGGAIFAGAYTQKNTLASLSEKLFFPKMNFTANQIGQDTPSSISYGIVFGIAGAVQKIIENIKSTFGFNNPSIFFTGGYGGKILTHLEDVFPNAIYDENLVFRGMAKLYENVNDR
ncbi:hypothetical protein MASR1M45_08260 [Candidatus Kapaibacterium sp.]